jgi:two-component system sensor histidine kinase KdpD
MASKPARMLRLAVSLGVVAGIVAVCASVPHVHVASVVLLLLLAILIVANRWGFIEAAAATILGAALLNYFFLPPRGIGITAPEFWVVFITFLGVALLGSYLAAQLTRRTDEAVARRREIESLYALGQELQREASPLSIVSDFIESLLRTFQLEAAAFYDLSTGEITRSGPKGNIISQDLLVDSARRSEHFNQGADEILCVPVHSGGRVVGSLAIFGGSTSELILRAITDRIEAALARASAYEELRQAQETERNQELKTALLNSLVHEIKTPMSVIKTAVSSLLSRDSDAASRRELLTIIDEEADRLDASISEAFWTARVEAGILQSGKAPHDVRPLVKETLDELKTLLAGRSVVVDSAESLPPANCDAHMFKRVLKELLTNALKYSPSDSPLTVSLQHTGDEIITRVTDSGIGIQPGEEVLIFQKHYRGHVRPPGAGLGLALAKTIVQSQGGRIWACNRPEGGSVFHFSLPSSPEIVTSASATGVAKV